MRNYRNIFLQKKRVSIILDGTDFLFRDFDFNNPAADNPNTAESTIGLFDSRVQRLVDKFEARQVVVVIDDVSPIPRSDSGSRVPSSKRFPRRYRSGDETSRNIPVLQASKYKNTFVFASKRGRGSCDFISSLANATRSDEINVICTNREILFLQCVSPNVYTHAEDDWESPYHLGGELLDESDVKKRFGVTPPLFVEYLALVGSEYNGIPSVPGFSPSAAVALLTDYGSLANVFAKIRTLPARTQISLKENKKVIADNIKMATANKNLSVAATVRSGVIEWSIG